LRNGQTVKILTVSGGRPNPAWLNFIVTGKARSCIRHFLKHQQREESIALGHRLLDQALAQHHLTLSQVKEETLAQLLKSSRLNSREDLCEEVGLGNQLAQVVAQRLSGEVGDLTVAGNADKAPLYIKGTEGVAVSFAACCHPIPGDPIEGVLTAGKGIVVHHEACLNLQEFRKLPDKCIPVRWEEGIAGDFEVALRIEIREGRGVYAAMALAMAEAEASISNIDLIERRGDYSLIGVTISVKNSKQLENVIRNVKKLPQITSAERHYNTSKYLPH
jgi:guanosine-3',5'-bis(diphosphate) 3'-pyrophosphohydrolase